MIIRRIRSRCRQLKRILFVFRLLVSLESFVFFSFILLFLICVYQMIQKHKKIYRSTFVVTFPFIDLSVAKSSFYFVVGQIHFMFLFLCVCLVMVVCCNYYNIF